MSARNFLSVLGFLGLCIIATDAHAAALTYRYQHHIYTVQSRPEWESDQEIWLYQGKPVVLPQELRAEGDVDPVLPAGFTKGTQRSWDASAIANTLNAVIGSDINRAPGTVKISRSASGHIVFEGAGMLGRSLDARQAAELTIQALNSGITELFLPIIETQPTITVTDPELKKVGIKEVVTIGESDFAGSPLPRRHNIAVGLARFNGHLIKQGELFSFNEVLGPVDARAGYKKELVIKGDKTLPDYGGGLCQISSTAYRGAWEYGFPIEERRNHSFAVSYYGPYGTDATIYPPQTDMQFTNDSPGALLIQTHSENDKAYFIYYGTRDARTSEVFGPYTWGFTAAPPDRTEETLDIPVGTTRKVGSRVPGLRAAWFRKVVMPDKPEEIEAFYSAYEARPLYYQVGVEFLPETATGDLIVPPDSL